MNRKRNFAEEILERRPDVAEAYRKSETKRTLAFALRTLRKKKGLTQKDIEKKSGLHQPVISRLESPIGSLPNMDSILRYLEACEGHMSMFFTSAELNTDSVMAEPKWVESGVVGAVAV